MSDTFALELDKAKGLHAKKLLSKAQHAYEALIEKDKKNAQVLHLLGVCYYQQTNLDKAIACLEKSIELEPAFVDAHYRLAIAYGKKNDNEKKQLLLEATTQLSPQHFPALFQLGNFFMQKENIEKAISYYQRAEKIKIDHYELQVNLGHAYFLNKEFLLARDNYHYALELEPSDPVLHFNLGIIAEKENNENQAINHYLNAIKVDENHFPAHFNVALLFLIKDHPSQALEHLKKVRALNYGDESTDYLIKALEKDERLKRAPASYIENLFDQYADHYDLHLTKGLAYNVPKAFKALHENSKRHDKTLLDLGCGTGLCGSEFKDTIEHIDGVDLSANMLALAKKTQCYKKLYQQDVFTFLNKTTKRYDLMIAGDVFVYIGELEKLFPLIAHALNDNGCLIFNVEKTQKPNYHVDQSGRFKHHEDYIVTLAKTHGFTVTQQQAATTRYQNNIAVDGWEFVLVKA